MGQSARSVFGQKQRRQHYRTLLGDGETGRGEGGSSPQTCSFEPAKSMVLTPRTCCWAGRAAEVEATAEALTAPAAATKVRRWTAGEANWRPRGARRALEKLREAMVGGGGVVDDQRETIGWGVSGWEQMVLWVVIHRLGACARSRSVVRSAGQNLLQAQAATGVGPGPHCPRAQAWLEWPCTPPGRVGGSGARWDRLVGIAARGGALPQRNVLGGRCGWPAQSGAAPGQQHSCLGAPAGSLWVADGQSGPPDCPVGISA